MAPGDSQAPPQTRTVARAPVAGGTVSEEPATGTIAPFGETVGYAPGEIAAEVPAVIGPWRVVRLIGRGGMGAVYLGERENAEFQQKAAVKLIRGGGDDDVFRRRFRAERQILAALQHPNIARLLDGGTTADGRPYFAMEYIEGERIDDWVAARRLSTRERVQLFRQLCAAVHHAHQQLVVHRDIKPGNVLVTRDGIPKLLDFGIAKLLQPDGSANPDARTETGAQVMTPEYASPEQIRGEAVGTASDVYSLGVLLYELLTGQSPYVLKARTALELERVVCLEEPLRPSLALTHGDGATRRAALVDVPRVRHALSGDLDLIVLMAMRKEPSRRYASALELAEDLRRWQEGLPVAARPDTLGYRAGKFVRRHRAGVTAAALVVLSLAGGLVATVQQARVARLEKARAERRFAQVRELSRAMLFDVHDAIQDLPGSTPARKILVGNALRYLDSLSADAADDDSLQQELATAYLKVGDVQGRAGFANLGDTAGARASYDKALALREALARRAPNDRVRGMELATAYDRVADVKQIMSDSAGALEDWQKALALRTALAAHGRDPVLEQQLALSCDRVADGLTATGKYQQALELRRRSLAIREPLLRESDPILNRQMMVGLIKLGDALLRAHDVPGAQSAFARAEQIGARLAADPDNGRAQRDLALVRQKVGNAFLAAGDHRAALASYRQAMQVQEVLAARDPQNAEAQRDLVVAWDKVGAELLALGDTAGALDYARRERAACERAAARDPSNAQARYDLSLAETALGERLMAAAQRAEALTHYERGLRLHQEVSDADRADQDVRRELADAYVGAALRTFDAAADCSRQAAWLARGVALLDELKVPADDATRARAASAVACRR